MHDFNEYELHSPESLFHEGMDLLESDHFEEALMSFEKLVFAQPYNADALFQQGVTLIKLGRVADAIKCFESAISLSPTEPTFHSHCGYALLMAGNHDAALEKFDYALHLQPDNYEHKIYKACVLAEKLRLREAYEILKDLSEEHPDNQEVLRHYASILYLLGEDHDALLAFERLIKADPNNLDAIHHRGLIFLRQSNRPDAVRCFREYLALASHDHQTWAILLDTLTELDQQKAVIATAGEAIQSGVETAYIYLYRGRALLEDRQYNDAILDLRRSRALDDQNPETHFLLAQALAERGRLKHALLSANRTLQLLPGDRRALLLKARVCRELESFEEEYEALELLGGFEGTDFQLLQMLVDNLNRRDLSVQARDVTDLFLSVAPTHRRALLMSAELNERNGNMDLAHQRYETLLAQQGVSTRSFRAYAGFLLRRQEKLKAAHLLERAAREHPTSDEIQTMRAVVFQMLDRHGECIKNLTAYISQHSCPPETHWLLGKSWYALKNYHAALESFQRARLAGAGSAAGPDAPEFKCLMAEAYSLHHLGRTVEGITLLEENGRRFDSFAREFYEILSEFYNHICAYSKACAVATEGLARFPHSPVLHYRFARCCAALRRKRAAFRHLRLAINIDPALAATACKDNRFQAYALSPTLNGMLNYHFYRRRLEFLGIVLLVLLVAVIVASLLR